MSPSSFPVISATRRSHEFGSKSVFVALSLFGLLSLLPLHLLERHGAVAHHWFECVSVIALGSAAAAAVVRRADGVPQNQELVDIPGEGGWSPELTPPAPVLVPDFGDTRDDPQSSRLAIARQAGHALAQIRIRHRLREPVHHARMIARDLEGVAGLPDGPERVRSLRAHLDEIARTVGETLPAFSPDDVRIAPMSQEEVS